MAPCVPKEVMVQGVNSAVCRLCRVLNERKERAADMRGGRYLAIVLEAIDTRLDVKRPG